MLVKNDVFKDEHGHLRRLLAVDEKTDTAWVYRIAERNAFPQRTSWRELRRRHEAGALKTITELGPDETLSEEVRQLKAFELRVRAANVAGEAATKCLDERWQRIAPLVSDPGILDSHSRGPLVANRAKELKCSQQTLVANLRLYWAGGQEPAALTGYLRAEPRAGNKTVATAGRGRRPLAEGSYSYPMTERDCANVEAALKKHYLRDKRRTLASAFQRMLEDRYSETDGNGQRSILPPGHRPSFRQFRYVANKAMSLEQRLRGREGDKNFERDHRARLGTVMEDCLGPGHMYEVDATIADCYLVSAERRQRIIGKPTLYLIVDRFSRLIAGFAVTLENASWAAGRLAVLSLCDDMKEVCARYGVDYDAADWPAQGFAPEVLLADRGEFISKASDQLTSGVNIQVANLPSCRPDWKPLVECGFKLVHQSLADVDPSYDPTANALKRQNNPYYKGACLTLHEFTRVILLAIIKHNRAPLRGYPLSAEARAAGVNPAPRNIWAFEAPRRSGALRRLSKEIAQFALLPTDQASVSDRGIQFGGCLYSCDHAIEKGWFVAGRKRRFKVTVSYDSRRVDAIYVHDKENPGGYFVATLLESRQRFQGMSFAEVKAAQCMDLEDERIHEQQRRQVISDFHAEADKTVDSAKKATKLVTKGVSRSARRADTKLDRSAELREERNRTAAPLPGMDNADPPKSPAKVIPLNSAARGAPEETASPEGAPRQTRMEKALEDMRKRMFHG